MSKIYCEIVADYGDDDNVRSLNVVDSNYHLEIIRKFAKLISESSDTPFAKNWDVKVSSTVPYELYVISEKASEKELSIFEEYVPWHERGIHTIKSINLLVVTHEENLLS